ncbi:MAG: triacylglycerol lipase [Lachnospiraceae bacterium]|nr:triacylglycerol lipase [Lachnospiraceae bacterium]
MAGGYEIIVSSFWALFIELAVYGWMLGPGRENLLASYAVEPVNAAVTGIMVTPLVNAVAAGVVWIVHFMNGFWRTVFTGSQIGVGMRLLMLFCWWLPVVNLVIFHKWCKQVRRELIYEKDKYLLDVAREVNQVCRTKYPVVMVHGIFFRDWQFFNYWGRVPKELKQNGANVYYGNQQSSLSVAESAAELKQEILRILQESGAEKVNIVAHSKGGLDSRYAISKLGLEDKVASLTTINTPHRGCEFADALLNSLPKGLIHFVADKYNKLFHKLGDVGPDFLAGVSDLTACACAAFNEEVKDSPQVYYQSVMSRMSSVQSAGFPLNLGYLLSKKYEGANDGLVSVTSAQWGEFMGVISAKHQGVSHGDMIDLMRRNIKGFDVSEFYVKLFEELKRKGF